jgi:hypothetical protein
MSADQAGRVHRMVSEAGGSADNFTYVARVVLREERAAGWDEGYADAMADQYEAARLAEAREPEAAAAAGLLTEAQRFQVAEARDCLATWDLARAPGVISRESALADQVRNLLAIIDAVALAGTTVNDHHQEESP